MQTGETFKPASAAEATSSTPGHPVEISWTASEYIAHHKSSGWYVLLGLAAALLAGGIYLVTGDAMSTGVIIVVCIIFGYAASRQPRTLSYSLDQSGIMIDQKFYPYHDFKSFGVMDEDAIYSVQLLPMKRFMPGISIYYPPDHEDKILTILATYLPHEERTADMVDRLARKLRF